MPPGSLAVVELPPRSRKNFSHSLRGCTRSTTLEQPTKAKRRLYRLVMHTFTAHMCVRGRTPSRQEERGWAHRCESRGPEDDGSAPPCLALRRQDNGMEPCLYNYNEAEDIAEGGTELGQAPYRAAHLDRNLSKLQPSRCSLHRRKQGDGRKKADSKTHQGEGRRRQASYTKCDQVRYRKCSTVMS